MIIKTKNHRKIVIAVTVLLLVCGVAVTFIIYRSSVHKDASPAGGVDYNPPTSEQKNAGSTTKDGNINSSNTADSVSSKDGTTPNQSSPASGTTVTMTIPYAQQSDSVVRITTDIATVTSSGQCVLTMTKSGSSSFTQTVGVQALSSSSTCMGFSVPVSSLATGVWTIAVNYSNGSATGSASSSVTVQ